MMYFVTTGTSLSESSRCWLNPDDESRFLQKYRDFSWQEFLEEDERLRERAAREGSTVLSVINEIAQVRQSVIQDASKCQLDSDFDAVVKKYFDKAALEGDHRHLLPAELATLLTIARQSAGRRISPQDQVIFLGGETNHKDARLCASILRLACDHFHKGEPLLPNKTHIVVDDDRNWDPHATGNFLGTMQSLWSAIQTQSQNQLTSFVLTGGYKGVSLDLAMRIGRAVNDNFRTTIYYLHEDAPRDRPSDGLIEMNVTNDYFRS